MKHGPDRKIEERRIIKLGKVSKSLNSQLGVNSCASGTPKLPEVILDLCLFRKARGFKFSKEPVT